MEQQKGMFAVIWIYCLIMVLFPGALVHASLPEKPPSHHASAEEIAPVPGSAPDQDERAYLFIHDTSKNMRRKKRIPMMQTSIRKIIEALPDTVLVGLHAFGHRFAPDGPDACYDSENIIPLGSVSENREDFEFNFNLLAAPPVGGGAPVGFALQEGISDFQSYHGQKEIFLYLVDLQRCPGDKPLEVIRSVCEINNLHLTLIGIGLKRDFETLQEARIDQLGNVDLLNILTPDDAEALPDRLLTRLSLRFKNADGALVDPRPGEKLVLTLDRLDENGKITPARKKIKDSSVKGASLETVGLEEGRYLIGVSYEGQKLRHQKEIFIAPHDEIVENIQLGRMIVDVTDSQGNLIQDPVERQVKVTVMDAGEVIRTAKDTAHAEFDVLPGKKYNVLVSYSVGGDIQSVHYNHPITIQEGNHQQILMPLPLGAISGTVLNMKGNPSQETTLTLSPAPGDPQEALARRITRTDANGHYRFSDIRTGTYTLTLDKAGYKREKYDITVVGGRIKEVEDIHLFQGIEISVGGVSGKSIDDADVALIDVATSKNFPVTRFRSVYRNATSLPPGLYHIAVRKPGYQEASQDLTFTENAITMPVSFSLPYYITVNGYVVNGKQEAVPDASLHVHQISTRLHPSEARKGPRLKTDGTFQTQLLVVSPGEEQLTFSWRDVYNQEYTKQVAFPVPAIPGEVKLGKVLLPISFLRLTLHDVLDHGVSADTILLTHRESGQSGLQMNRLANGIYESTALIDGHYTLRILKSGYQEAEQELILTAGEVQRISLKLANYITVTGTVVDGRHNRLSGARIDFTGLNSDLTSSQPIITGRDGGFQATLLVKHADQEQINVSWRSSKSEEPYQLSSNFPLPGIPITELSPKNIGKLLLPANFIQVEVEDASRRGLPGATVQFLAQTGKSFKGKELGDGFYESPDLPDGYYTIAITKNGYKENVLLADIFVGREHREITLGPVLLPHYATVMGTILNGKDQGIPNVELAFSNTESEQLKTCRTDQHGRFSTTLLVTGSGEETWKASWDKDTFNASGGFPLPVQPQEQANLGEIRLPVNFVSIPVQDIQGNALTDVELTITHKNNSLVTNHEYRLEETDAGTYEAQNLPDGMYTIGFRKRGYELGKTLDIIVQDGEHLFLNPIRLGHYVTLIGQTLDGRQEPVANALIRFDGLSSTVIASEEPETALPSETADPTDKTEEQSVPQIRTDKDGKFSTRLLVTDPGIEQLVVTWAEQQSSQYPVQLVTGPQTQHITLRLPINFIYIDVTDNSGRALPSATITLTHQLDNTNFVLQETQKGSYQSQGLPDGDYLVQVHKHLYDSQRGTLTVRGGEIEQRLFRLNHYITVKGSIVDGKDQGISAATVTFTHLKTAPLNKLLSGTEGAFEAKLLVKEPGKETGTVTWTGKHGTYTQQFWLDLPKEPAQIDLTQDQTRLPINYIAIEVKSVAATGIAGATIRLTHQETGQAIEAHDNDNGNYEALELPDGTYDILITKDRYQPVLLNGITVADGENKSDILIPKFLHYITISGVIVNGKNEGVPQAIVQITEPKSVKECDPFPTRKDGSFTLYALVTDIGTETIDVVWNSLYTIALPVKLPLFPEHIRLESIKLPINFITVMVQNIYGSPLPGAKVSFTKKQQPLRNKNIHSSSPDGSLTYMAREVEPGVYESPALPDHEYLLIVRKNGYVQSSYPPINVKGGMTIPDASIQLPHILTVKGRVINGKGEGVSGVTVDFREKNSQKSTGRITTDTHGYFAERLQIVGTGPERLTLFKAGETNRTGDYFELSREFSPLATPGEQDLAELRLPINFVPIRVHDVAGRSLEHAHVFLTPITTNTNQWTRKPDPIAAFSLEQGTYEGRHLKNGAYQIAVEKEGYNTQEKTVKVHDGEIASDIEFTLPHYVTVKGLVTDGKGNGVANAVLTFSPENAQLVPLHSEQQSQPLDSILTNLNGQFTARLLVTHAAEQHVQISWNNHYVKQLSFPLPDQPEPHYHFENDIRLPINSSPFRITNVLGEGIAGVDIRLHPKKNTQNALRAHALGDGYYEADKLLDGTYGMTIHKDGYQDVTGEFTVQGGEQLAQQDFSLPHYVTLQGTVLNGKGIGVPGAAITLQGRNSHLLTPNQAIVTAKDGSFQMALLVTGQGSSDLQEHLEITWTSDATGSTSGTDVSEATSFTISHDFSLPTTPQPVNLGLLSLPANFLPVLVQDVSGKGLTGVNVTFLDETGRVFPATELPGGFYEGQNLPDGVYTVDVKKDGYQSAQRSGVRIMSGAASTTPAPLTFHLPYYVTIQGTVVNGKGQEISSGIRFSLAGCCSQLLPETTIVDPEGNFSTTLLVNATGQEQLHISWKGQHGLHGRNIPLLLPETPQTMPLHRVKLPINFIPIEVKDLRGYGITKATVKLHHLETSHEITAAEGEKGQYEGQDLLDGSYRITIERDGYKPVEQAIATVAGGLISETKSFRLSHYVWITGTVTNGDAKGVRDPSITTDKLHSLEQAKQSDMTGNFELTLEVHESGNERMHIKWKNLYSTAVLFKLPDQPEKKDLGEIRLPINFVSVLVTDISGSMLPGVEITVYDSSEQPVQRLETDQNGYCKTDDIPDGIYRIVVKKAGYKLEERTVPVEQGQSVPIRFTLAHYVTVQGQLRDIMEKAIGGAEVIFEEFFDPAGQKLRTRTDPVTGQFEQRLLIDDPGFLERQKGHFHILKEDVEQVFTFKIPTAPNQIIHYKTLLFPTNYLHGKVVDATFRFMPIEEATVTLIPSEEQTGGSLSARIAEQVDSPRESPLRFTTDSLGIFKAGHLPQGEYKITIEKDGYLVHEDFLQISSLFQEQEFALQKEQ